MNLEKRHTFVPPIAATIFMGAVGRLLAMVKTGHNSDGAMLSMLVEFGEASGLAFAYWWDIGRKQGAKSPDESAKLK